MDGIFNVHKPVGVTSHDVVAKMRKLLKQRRVGHAGTLDPAASGVLPICAGQATRVAEYLSESGKAYRATIIFGVETDTYDAEGEVTRVASVEKLDQASIEQALAHFRGKQMQIPPRYSAIKIQGQTAYKRVRAGEELVMEGRPIEITSLEMRTWQKPALILDIECSKGTYIRSLAYDLGRELNCGAHLGGLVRTRSGPFCLEESSTLEELTQASEQGKLAAYIQPADLALQQYPALYLHAEEAERVAHGNPFRYETAEQTRSLARVYNSAGKFIAIAAWQPQDQKWQPRKVFGEERNNA